MNKTCFDMKKTTFQWGDGTECPGVLYCSRPQPGVHVPGLGTWALAISPYVRGIDLYCVPD